MGSSLCSPVTAQAMASEVDRLLDFARAAALPGGFGWLDDEGHPMERDLELWITCRMTHVCALGDLLGRPGFGELVDHGVAALTNAFHDDAHDGWYAALTPDGSRPTSTEKQAYGHAFVILAASSAQAAGRPGTNDLLADALAVHDRYFWDEHEGMARESFSANWLREEPYRGINANMHTVEAYLAAGDVTGDRLWHERAGRIVTRAVNDFARNNAWRLPEHFDTQWHPLPDYNEDQPAHPFRPYGATIGHGLEWARLTLATAASLGGLGGLGAGRDVVPRGASAATPDPGAPDSAVGDQPDPGAPDPSSAQWDWAVGAATGLVHRAVTDGWATDGNDGFVYTTDWSGTPVVRARMHWVLAEALGAAWALHQVTGDPQWSAQYAKWWAYAEAHFIDAARGSWHHELAPDNTPAAVTWVGKPDVYHALQAMLLPRLPLIPSFATATARAAAGSVNAPAPT